jgi:hypothetical protein
MKSFYIFLMGLMLSVQLFAQKEEIKVYSSLEGLKDEQLAEITILDFSEQSMPEMPRRLKLCKKLKVLKLNKMQDFDLMRSMDIISFLTSLEELYLEGNELMRIPRDLSNLSNLKLLSLADNQLEELSEGLADMGALEQLILHHNSLKTIPEFVERLETLKLLDLSENPLSLSEERLKEYLEYFKEHKITFKQ